MKTESLLWLLMWAVLGVVLLIGQYQQKVTRDYDRLHTETSASMIPPSTLNVSTR